MFLRTFILFLSLAFSSIVSAAALNINTANAKQLAQTMSGIGIKKAEAIVEYRKTHGDFKTLDELVKVKGIGAKTVIKNREKLTIEN